MHTENTEGKLFSVFSVWLSSVADKNTNEFRDPGHWPDGTKGFSC